MKRAMGGKDCFGKTMRKSEELKTETGVILKSENDENII